LIEIESSNLNLFDFDYDLTFMVFFISPDERVYARYGGRCEQGPDARQSLEGLRYTMESVLAEHESRNPRTATTRNEKPFFIREIAPPRGMGRCIHCHQAKEVIYNRLDEAGEWKLDLAFRFPLPENLGVKLNVDRGNQIESIAENSPAEAAGLRVGDTITMLNHVPIHSFGDAQYALDLAPQNGSIPVVWRRGDESIESKLKLPDRWRRSDISWRPSLKNFVASARVYGKNLTTAEKESIGLTADHLAFRQKDSVPDQAKSAGVHAGDIIIGVDNRELEMSVYEFLTFVRSNYVRGETVILNVVRNRQALKLKMKLE
jgi:predicted metalloprotease with PDZ domain